MPHRLRQLHNFNPILGSFREEGTHKTKAMSDNATSEVIQEVGVAGGILYKKYMGVVREEQLVGGFELGRSG